MTIEAENQLRNHQKQLDADGCMVGVSRQAVDEVLAEIERLRGELAAERERCIAIVMAARMGEIDQDFRSIIARMK